MSEPPDDQNFNPLGACVGMTKLELEAQLITKGGHG